MAQQPITTVGYLSIPDYFADEIAAALKNVDLNGFWGCYTGVTGSPAVIGLGTVLMLTHQHDVMICKMLLPESTLTEYAANWAARDWIDKFKYTNYAPSDPAKT